MPCLYPADSTLCIVQMPPMAALVMLQLQALSHRPPRGSYLKRYPSARVSQFLFFTSGSMSWVHVYLAN